MRRAENDKCELLTVGKKISRWRKRAEEGERTNQARGNVTAALFKFTSLPDPLQ